MILHKKKREYTDSTNSRKFICGIVIWFLLGKCCMIGLTLVRILSIIQGGILNG